MLQGKYILVRDHIIFLGSRVSKDGGTDDDIQNWINKASFTFSTLQAIWCLESLFYKTRYESITQTLIWTLCMAQRHGESKKKYGKTPAYSRYWGLGGWKR